MSRRRRVHHSNKTDWNGLLSQLPEPLQARFERVLRRSLKRRLQQIERLESSAAPDVVRSQAVSAWRRQYMRGESKSAKKRMNYARLRDDPTYLEIERDLLARYWSDAPGGPLPPPSGVNTMAFCDVCETYRATRPKRGGTSLDALLLEVARHVYAECNPATSAREKIAKRVCRDARTRRFDKRVDSRAPSFDLVDVTSKGEAAERVRSCRLVEHLLRVAYHNVPVHLVAREHLVACVVVHPLVVATNDLMRALLDVPDCATAVLEKCAKSDARAIEKYLLGQEMTRRVVNELLQNPYYGAQYQRAVELRLRVRESVPRTPMEAYPLARTMVRRFVVHVGPTNSGKTHDALEALAAAASGAYLGPLRLLAYEQFEALNRMGCVCSLLTGEESVELAGAHHVSSTVEMANFYEPVDVAVIDEAQMIADASRGYHWTAAILGMPAKEVHVCCAPHAEHVASELVSLCEDTLTVVRQERLVPLKPYRSAFRVPEDVRAGDALVVFSRKSVHAVASQIASAGLTPSLVYGALPHDVRHEEARRFDEGETDVVVATDAIGMGMNLPIRRVVFVEQSKFDGRDVRVLKPEEVQQIAGRAGRFGRYDVGYFTSTRLRKDMVRRAYQPVPPIESVPVGIPEDIALVLDATLSDCIRQWMTMDQPEPFRRIGVGRDLTLIGKIEAKLNASRRMSVPDKLLVLSLATMAFDERDKNLYRTWQRMVNAELAGRELELDVPPEPTTEVELVELEAQYRYCDLLYTYARTFKHPERLELLSLRRNQISHAIMDVLAKESPAAS